MIRRPLPFSFALALLASAPPAMAQTAAPTLNTGDTAWILTSTLLVILMSIPGLALFYGGLARAKNMLSVLTQVFVIYALISVLWAIYGYTLAFGGSGLILGDIGKHGLGARIHYARNTGDKSARRDDDFIARTYIQGFERHIQRQRAIGQRHGIARLAPGGKFFFKFAAFLPRPIVDLVRQQYARNGIGLFLRERWPRGKGRVEHDGAV